MYSSRPCMHTVLSYFQATCHRLGVANDKFAPLPTATSAPFWTVLTLRWFSPLTL